MVTVQLLSIHADDEQTLNERNTLLTVRLSHWASWAWGRGSGGSC